MYLQQGASEMKRHGLVRLEALLYALLFVLLWAQIWSRARQLGLPQQHCKDYSCNPLRMAHHVTEAMLPFSGA